MEDRPLCCSACIAATGARGEEILLSVWQVIWLSLLLLLSFQLGIEGIIDQFPSFYSDLIRRADKTEPTTQQIETCCRRLQADLLQGIGLIDDASHPLQDW